MSDQRIEMQQRRTELAEQIARGEESLLASSDNRTRRALDQKLTAMRNELQHLTTQLMTSSRESRAEFSERHGGERVYIDGWFLYPDGAASDRYDTFRRDPPTDPIELLKARRQFVQAKLDAEVAAFNRFDADTQQQQSWHILYPSSCPPAAPNAEEQLAKGRDRIFWLRAELVTIDAELSKTPEAIARRQAEESGRQRQLAANERLANIRAITLEG